jgi:ATP-dependent Zn protease
LLLKGRTGGTGKILHVYARKVKLSDDVGHSRDCQGNTGYDGADLENLMNEAAIRLRGTMQLFHTTRLAKDKF